MNIKYTYLFFVSCFLFFGNVMNAEINQDNSIELITTKKEFIAGETIILEFITYS